VRYRKLSANQDMQFGHSQADFWRDVPDAPAQAVLTRLNLWKGEWFLDTSDGTPWQTQVLGNRTNAVRDPVLQSRLLGTTGITELVSYASQVNRDTRGFAVQATLNTRYGGIAISLPVTLAASVPVRTPYLFPLTTQGGDQLTTQAGDALEGQR